MKLYYSPGACSLSPHIALHEAGLPFEAQYFHLGLYQTQPVRIHEISPDGQVIRRGPDRSATPALAASLRASA